MIVHGLNPTLEALRSGAGIDRIVVRRGYSGGRLAEVVGLAKSRGIPVRFEPLESLNRLAGTPKHQGVAALLSSVEWRSLEEILERSPNLLLVIDNLEDPRNLGAVLRTAEAAGVDAVLLPDRRCPAVNATVIKASAGAALHLKMVQIGNVARTLERLKSSGLWIVGMEADGPTAPDQIDVGRPLALVVGGEHRGLRPLVRRHCDYLVSLPMSGQVNSLNLSVAAGVLIYQIVLQRKRIASPKA